MHTYKGTVCISDSEFKYAYLVEAQVKDSYITNVRLYFPDFSPEAYDKHPTYFLNISCFNGSQEIPLILSSFDRSEALACAPILNDRNNYYEYIDFCCHKKLPPIDRFYISLTPVIITGKTVRPDINYNSGQSALIENTSDIMARFDFKAGNNEIKLIPTLSGIEMTLNKDYLSSIYGSAEYFIQYHVFVAGPEKIYEAIESDIYPVPAAASADAVNNWYVKIKEDIMTQFSNDSNMETSHERWEVGLKLTGTIVIYKSVTQKISDMDDGLILAPVKSSDNKYEIKEKSESSSLENYIHVVKFAGLMTDPLPITQELYAQWCYGSNEEINLDNMEIIQPRIINKTIKHVHEITSRTDPHINTVQTVFFKVRDLANIVVHPEVTENICINLDAYKSQCDSFMLKIEGTIFPEISRVEAGIIFKIRSNMLPGKVNSGIYYILDQDAELVTTGKYYYER